MHDEAAAEHREVASRLRQLFGHQRYLKASRHAEELDVVLAVALRLYLVDERRLAVVGDFGVPAGLDGRSYRSPVASC